MVHEFEPRTGLAAVSTEPALDSLSPPPPPPPAAHPLLSLKINK